MTKETRNIESNFVVLAEQYSSSYDSQKPALMEEIDKVLDEYLSFTTMESPTMVCLKKFSKKNNADPGEEDVESYDEKDS